MAAWVNHNIAFDYVPLIISFNLNNIFTFSTATYFDFHWKVATEKDENIWRVVIWKHVASRSGS